LYRWSHVRRADRIYTQSPVGPDRRFYRSEGIACYVFDRPLPGTVPLYRWRNDRDHFYTTAHDGENASRRGYKLEGIACFVYRDPRPGTAPFYRFVDPGSQLHFYSTDANAEFGKSSKGNQTQ